MKGRGEVQQSRSRSPNLPSSPLQKHDFEYEIYINTILGSHPNVPEFFGACHREAQNLCLIMQYFPLGSAEDLFITNKTLGANEVLSIKDAIRVAYGAAAG